MVRSSMMHGDRFFESTRGKIVTALRGRSAASAFDLAAEFGLSPNAIRQQLVILERDGLIAGRSVRRGKTKPTLEYSLTADAEKLFPQQYDRMLNAVLREVRQQGGDAAVRDIFAGLSRRTSARLNERLEGRPAHERIAELTAGLQAAGVAADFEPSPDGFTLREHNCPLAKTVGEHPEVCTVIHGIMKDVISPAVVQTESLATGGQECRFDIRTH
ncbi:MAG: helix-turn-helix transcriptional regulator [Candidatus Velthaea sp.]